MSGTWWVGKKDLDSDQKGVMTLPLDGSYLVLGPPGSGKTNLLLLRANFLHLAGHTNLQVILFTRTLRDFLASGGEEYDFPLHKIVTCRQWQQAFLREHGVPYELPDAFDKQREYLVHKINTLIDRENLTNLYDAILLDEAHDYIPAEIQIFKRLAERLFLVADTRQKIYQVEDSIETLREVTDETKTLRYHYRNGLKICQVADAIAKKNDDYQALIDTSQYDERANPSNVKHFRCNGIEDEADKIVARLDAQLKAFPGEFIGIVCPKREDLLRVWHKVQASPFADSAALQLGDDRVPFDADRPIVLCTFHAAKGLEVRSLHMAGCDTLKRFGHNRNMVFTAVTRAKSSLTLYYSDDIHPYLESALGALAPMPDVPELDDVFGKRGS